MRWTYSLLGLVLLTLTPWDAYCQQSTPSQDAKQLFLRGRDAVKRGKLQDALEMFKESQKLSPKLGTLLNLAECEEKLGQYASAWQHFEELLAALRPGDERIFIARKAETRLESRISKLRVYLISSAPEDTTVTCDDFVVEPSTFGADRPLAPGKHTLELKVPGRTTRVYEVNLSEGAKYTITTEPEPALSQLIVPSSSPAPIQTASQVSTPGVTSAPIASTPTHILTGRPADSRPARTAAFITGGVGLLALGAGAVTGAVAIVKKNDVEALCPNSKQCNEEGVTIERTARDFAGVSTGAFATGFAMLGVSVVLFLVDRRGGEVKPAVVPVLAMDGIGIAGAF